MIVLIYLLTLETSNKLFKIIGLFNDCQKDIGVVIVPEEKQGFCNKLLVNCNHCNWSYSCYTSSQMPLEKEKPGKKKLRQINFCSVTAFREIGRGHESMNVFKSNNEYATTNVTCYI